MPPAFSHSNFFRARTRAPDYPIGFGYPTRPGSGRIAIIENISSDYPSASISDGGVESGGVIELK